MSLFSGKQNKGAMATVRTRKRHAAFRRQLAYVKLHPWALDPHEMLGQKGGSS